MELDIVFHSPPAVSEGMHLLYANSSRATIAILPEMVVLQAFNPSETASEEVEIPASSYTMYTRPTQPAVFEFNITKIYQKLKQYANTNRMLRLSFVGNERIRWTLITPHTLGLKTLAPARKNAKHKEAKKELLNQPKKRKKSRTIDESLPVFELGTSRITSVDFYELPRPETIFVGCATIRLPAAEVQAMCSEIAVLGNGQLRIEAKPDTKQIRFSSVGTRSSISYLFENRDSSTLDFAVGTEPVSERFSLQLVFFAQMNLSHIKTVHFTVRPGVGLLMWAIAASGFRYVVNIRQLVH